MWGALKASKTGRVEGVKKEKGGEMREDGFLI